MSEKIFLATQAGLDAVESKINAYSYVPDGAGCHNNFYRGKDLGTSVTDGQWSSISSGTFKDLFIGDFWTINGTVYRIAAFDYWLHCGDQELTKHHAVIVPDACIGESQKMNDTDTTDGAYYGSQMRSTNIKAAQTTITNDFTAAHIVTRREFWLNACTEGRCTGGKWDDASIELMNEQMVYGSSILEARTSSNVFHWTHTTCKSQLPLFGFRPDLIVASKRVAYWLQNVCSSIDFAIVSGDGAASCSHASGVLGVRPAFPIS